MRIKGLKLTKFRRFSDLEIKEIPKTVKLVVIVGPNGCGKSSIFDSLLLHYRMTVIKRYQGDSRYYNLPEDSEKSVGKGISITAHDDAVFARGSLYIRTAYRHEPDFKSESLSRQNNILDNFDLFRLIDLDNTVAKNYARLASHALEDVFVNEAASTTIGAYRDKLIGEIREPLRRLFPDLVFLGIGNPLSDGTFQFRKGAITPFDYKNLSGGEKAAFDLILDFIIKRKSYPDAVYCIDEPEMHMNTKIQGPLLSELVGLLPEKSQLWIASHSIGMMRRARELYDADPSSVAFLDFSGRDFDKPTVITPSKPSRAFWEGVMNVALDDLATLVAPREVVICEGNPVSTVQGKNVEHDARVYSTIFAEELPDVTFISAGSANQVSGDFLALATTLPKVVTGMKIRRVIDLDDHAPSDVDAYKQEGIIVLGRRHIEAYLFDDEVLTALCHSMNKSGEASAVLAAKQQAITDSIGRGNPADDIKSAAGKIYTETKRLLNLTQVGNDRHSFARNTLAPLIKPGMTIYANLKFDIFNL